jgi:methyl-accepting chemotaxis protein
MATLGKLVVEPDMGRAAHIANRRMGEIQRSNRQVVQSLRSIQAGARMVVRGLGAIGITYGMIQLVNSMKAISEEIDKVAKMSARIGISTEALSELQYVAERSGVSVQSLGTALQRMVRRISEAAKGTGEAKNAIKELGLDAQQLAQLAPDQQFMAIAQAMEQVATQGDKVRLAMKLWDTEGVALLQTLKGGAQAVEELRQRARDLGPSPFSRPSGRPSPAPSRA